jgi:hypothetical protein
MDAAGTAATHSNGAAVPFLFAHSAVAWQGVHHSGLGLGSRDLPVSNIVLY